ncbi:MAG: hypothetical protein QOI21_5158, partial [Actinomycetota bacterium]|nr:hypothetical protein [Actinomycetota bacterium]
MRATPLVPVVKTRVERALVTIVSPSQPNTSQPTTGVPGQSAPQLTVVRRDGGSTAFD